MYKTKMIKVYLPSFQICIFSLIINLLVSGIQPFRTIAQDSRSLTDTQQAANNAPATIEPEILSEINRVRTNPQDYARWLESQRQYYDGIWLKLPGEKPIRTNKGLKALNEAIAILQEQPPLAPLSESEATAAIANDKLNNFATANNIEYISYGRTTPKGIVLSLVVDDLFPDRRRRKSLLSPDANNTGVVCKPDPTYAKVCAIAYSNSVVDAPEAESPSENQPEDTPEPVAETETTASQPEVPTAQEEPEDNPEPAAETQTTASQPEVPEAQEEPENTPEPAPEPVAETQTTTQDTETATETLPAPTSPQLPPTAKPEVEQPASENEQEIEVAQADDEEIDSEEESADNQEDESIEDSEEIDSGEESADNQEDEDTEVFESESEEPTEVATNSDSSRILENVERGILEEGDRVITEDGSFYDSYPLQGKSDESFIIYLESNEFDAFVALVDGQGNIVEQNDDISEENSNSRIKVTIPEDGTYNVIVNAYDEGGTGEYILTIRR